MRVTSRLKAVAAACLALCASVSFAAAPTAAGSVRAPAPANFADVLRIDVQRADQIAPSGESITPVRESALRDAAMILGLQYGLRDRSREICALIDAEFINFMDRRFEFGALLMGIGFLPPVISEASDLRMTDGRMLKVAKSQYRLDEPPRAVIVPPTWRDWIYQGLDPDLTPELPDARSLYPRTDRELAYWRSVLQISYAEGRRQAQDVFDANQARLKRTYDGMRRYYDLYKRGMVSAPVIASAESLADANDPNVMVVGGAVIRVTVDMRFITDTDKWVPLGN